MANEVETLIFKAQTKELNQAKKDLRKLKEAANDAGDATDSLGGKQKGFGAALKANRGKIAAAVAGFTALAYAVNRGLKAVEEAGANFSILNARLVTATGSTAAAAAAFKDLNEFALQTPFTLDESVNGFAKLVNLGLEPTKASMTSFANTSAAMGTSLEQMIEAVADASTMEMERLKEVGIKSRKEGDKVTFAFRGIETTVEQSSAAVLAYLTEIGNTTFAGAAIEQTKTLKGSISNLDQAFGNLAIAAGEVSGANDIFAKSNNDLSDSLNDKEFQEGVANLTTALAKIKAGLVGIGTSALQGVVDFITTTQAEEANKLVTALNDAEDKLMSLSNLPPDHAWYRQALQRVTDTEQAITDFNNNPDNRIQIQVAGLTSTDGFRDTETGTTEKPTETVADGISEGAEKELTAFEEKLNAERKLQTDFAEWLKGQEETDLDRKKAAHLAVLEAEQARADEHIRIVTEELEAIAELEQQKSLERFEMKKELDESSFLQQASQGGKTQKFLEKAAKSDLDLTKLTGKQKAKVAIGIGGDILASAAQNSETAFKMQKGLKIAETIQSTYSSATGAYDALADIPIVGPALGIAAAAAAVMAGMANVRAIQATQFNKGGSGGGGGRPSVPRSTGSGISASNAAQAAPIQAANDEDTESLAPSVINVTVDGTIDPSGARAIIEAINEATEDGLEINALVGT